MSAHGGARAHETRTVRVPRRRRGVLESAQAVVYIAATQVPVHASERARRATLPQVCRRQRAPLALAREIGGTVPGPISIASRSTASTRTGGMHCSQLRALARRGTQFGD